MRSPQGFRNRSRARRYHDVHEFAWGKPYSITDCWLDLKRFPGIEEQSNPQQSERSRLAIVWSPVRTHARSAGLARPILASPLPGLRICSLPGFFRVGRAVQGTEEGMASARSRGSSPRKHAAVRVMANRKEFGTAHPSPMRSSLRRDFGLSSSWLWQTRNGPGRSIFQRRLASCRGT